MLKQIIVADSSPLIALSCIEGLPILTKLFNQVLVPDTVANECLVDIARPGAIAIKNAINHGAIKVCSNLPKQGLNSLLEALDEGEAAAIQLASSMKLPLLIDERLGRTFAKNLGLKIIGTAGVLLLAKQHNIIAQVKSYIQHLKSYNYYLSDSLIQGLLEQAGEV